MWAGGPSASAVAYGSDFAIPVHVGVCPPPHQPSPGSAGVPPASCPCQRFLPRQCLRLSQLKWPSPTACPRMPQAVPQVEPFWIGVLAGLPPGAWFAWLGRGQCVAGGCYSFAEPEAAVNGNQTNPGTVHVQCFWGTGAATTQPTRRCPCRWQSLTGRRVYPPPARRRAAPWSRASRHRTLQPRGNPCGCPRCGCPVIPGLGVHKGRPYGCVQDDD